MPEPIKGQVFELQPSSLEEAVKYAEIISKSSVIPKDFQNQPGNILVAIQMGQEIGLKPLQALQNIAVINGRPCIWGDALPAIAMGSKLIEDFREDFDDKTWTATCSIKRHGIPTPFVRSFSMDDAKKANLWTKAGTWATYPKRMLQMRARAFAIRDAVPDFLKGLSVAEEALDITPVAEAEPLPAPRRLSAATVSNDPIPVTTAEPGLAPSSVPEPEWKQITAKFDGKCKACSTVIHPGDGVWFSRKQGLQCSNCDPTKPKAATENPTEEREPGAEG